MPSDLVVTPKVVHTFEGEIYVLTLQRVTPNSTAHFKGCSSDLLFYQIYVSRALKVALQIAGRKFYKNTKESSLYSQSLLIFICKIQVQKYRKIIRQQHGGESRDTTTTTMTDI